MSPLRRRDFLAGAGALALHRAARAAERPNILWITAEDLGPQLACYGYPLVRTPNLDRFASQGVRFSRAFTTAPVCSASRSAFNTGMYQTSTGTHHHRSHRDDGYTLPSGVRLITEHLRDQGYFTANVAAVAPGVRGTLKTDFNFTVKNPYDGEHWSQRRPGQPFFAHLNFRETHKGPAFPEARKQKELVDPARVPLPPYYPDHAVVRDEFANYLDVVNLLDRKVGAALEALEKDGLAANTLVFFFGDNGRCLLRGKQWLYDAGTHVPMIARWPGRVKPGVYEDVACMLDMTATTLWAALSAVDVPLPANLHGRPLFGPLAKPREVVFAARDRCDMTMDRIRSVRDRRYKYIRNLMPERPYTQHNDYIEKQYPTLGTMKALHAEGKLNAVQSLFMQPRKPAVEFYDTETDPHEVHNLADSPKHRKQIERFSRLLDEWRRENDNVRSE